MKESEYKWRKVSTSEAKCVLVEVGALISWCIYSYRMVMLLVPCMWASMTFLPIFKATATQITKFLSKRVLRCAELSLLLSNLLLACEKWLHIKGRFYTILLSKFRNLAQLYANYV